VQEAMQGGVTALILMVTGVVVIGIIKLIVSIFSKAKKAVVEQVDSNIKPFIHEKQKEFNEDKVLKLKNLLDNDIISMDEYEKRKKKLLS